MTDRMSNTYNSAMGTVKENLGSAIGNEGLAAAGSEQRTRADVNQKKADAKTHAEGLQNKAKGEIQKGVGSVTDNTSQEAKGHANAALGTKAAMGQLDIRCFSEAANTLYAIANGFNGEKQVIILLKSNTAPAGPSSLSWSVVSTTPLESLLTIYNDDILCHADPSGAFAVYSSDTNSDTGPMRRPGGYRYHPNLPKITDSTGPGGWANISIPKDLEWGSSSSKGRLFSLKDSSGTYHLYHAFAKPSGSNNLKFSVLNTGTNAMENSPVTWSLLPYGTDYRLFSWDGTKALPAVNSTAGLPMDDYINTQIGTVGDGKTSFMLIQTGSLSGYSSHNYKLNALTVTGPSAGQIQVVPSGVAVPDANINFKKVESSSGGGSSVWSTIGTVFSIIVSLVILSCLLKCFGPMLFKSKTKPAPVEIPAQEPEYTPPAPLDNKVHDQPLPAGFSPMMGGYGQNSGQLSGAFPPGPGGFPISGFPADASGVMPASTASGNFPVSGLPPDSGRLDPMASQAHRDPLRHLLGQPPTHSTTVNSGLSGSTLASTPAATNSAQSQISIANLFQSQGSIQNPFQSHNSIAASAAASSVSSAAAGPKTQTTVDKNIVSDNPMWHAADNNGPSPGSNSYPLQAYPPSGGNANVSYPMVGGAVQSSLPGQPQPAFVPPSTSSSDPPPFVGSRRRDSDVSLINRD
ncbi:hypothetical protein DFQ27_001236 [Actinomortierella ambigua]|uniref:Uncharacterized protein n=1 Tax=Actinomortierella ambigua TaxID=1343610 RepID=A0A9P6UCX7_9FUNG|nr:hypothetical protein DFQ27_001236 [Actinomortierella ambigua]